MMLESIFAYLVLGFSSTFFALALTVEPDEIIIEQVTVPASMEERGYTPYFVETALKAEIETIVSVAASRHEDRGVGAPLIKSGVDRLASSIGLEEAIEATQQIVGITGAYVTINFFENANKGYSAVVYVFDPLEINLLDQSRRDLEEQEPEKLIEWAGAEVLRLTDPYIYATYLYETAYYEEVNHLKQELLETEATAWIEEHLLRLEADDPNLLLFMNLRGLVARAEKDYALAIETFREILMIDDEFLSATVNLAWTNLELDFPEQTVRLLEEFVEDDEAVETYPIALVYYAEALFKLDRPDEALARLHLAQEIVPNLASAHLLEAEIHEAAGRAAAASDAFKRAEMALVRVPQQNYYEAH